MKENRLAGEKSPYLLQHQTNPVDWWPWGEEAFAAARREGKPVFLSIGYSTCHWCHVMAHESFENPEIAEAMNSGFINIKVDREERPDVDRFYMAYVQASTGSGGWPMSVWLTPEGKPFFGGTYFPPQDRYGRVGFPGLCRQIAKLWVDDRKRIESESVRITDALARSAEESAAAGEFPRGDHPLREAAAAFAGAFDAEDGGFGGAPKFPRASVFSFMMREALRSDDRYRDMVAFTLDKMAEGGLRDHLGGGFHRYSVDAFWHVPHFEKMLYDQAQLVVSYLEAWQTTGKELYRDVARQTLDYVLTDLTHPEGGFYSAEDADSLVEEGRAEHAEGAFYVWSRSELDDVLGTAAEVFCAHYGVEAGGNAPDESDPHGEFRGKNILHQRQSVAETAKSFGMTENDVETSLAASRALLLERRARRPRPHLDDKVITAWNGLMISAFSLAGVAWQEPRYLQAAGRAAEFLRTNLTRDGRLLRSWRGDPGAVEGFAEDYAFLIQGLLDLYEADFDDGWLTWALELQQRQEELFFDPAAGNFFNSVAGDALVALRMKEDYDGAEPAANSVSARNLLRLGRILNDGTLEARGRQVIAGAAATLQRIPTAAPQMLVALDLAITAPEQVVLAGPREDARLREANARLHGGFAPRRIVLHASGLVAERNPEVAVMQEAGGGAKLYRCENFVCQAPEVLNVEC